MFNLRFNQVFVVLLVMSVCTSFLLPADFGNPLRGVGKLFAPVAWPARQLGATVRERFAPDRPQDDRDVADVKLENVELKVLVDNLAGQLEEMRRINGEIEALGAMRAWCTRFRVIGSDPSPTRESLTISATSGDNVLPHMPVLYSVGVVGWIDRVNPLGAQVQLITDPNFRAAARFIRPSADGSPQVLKTTQPLLIGVGRGAMQITNIPLRETEGNSPPDIDAVRVGDYVVLDDPNWPLGLKYHRLGQVESIAQHDKAATFAKIGVRPTLNLKMLTSVMVMNRTTPDASITTANVNP